ncbi:MAG: hypothetical protein ACEY3D_03260 [Rickettsia sp.]
MLLRFLAHILILNLSFERSLMSLVAGLLHGCPNRHCEERSDVTIQKNN